MTRDLNTPNLKKCNILLATTKFKCVKIYKLVFNKLVTNCICLDFLQILLFLFSKQQIKTKECVLQQQQSIDCQLQAICY